MLFLSSAAGLPLRRDDVRRIVSAHARAAGITRPVTPQRLRASFATALVAAGIDPVTLQTLMGHESIATTLKTYTALDEAQLRQVWQRTNPLAHLLPAAKAGEPDA